jgi:RTX calcium-binding nonapeptide repeat (4 copies)
MDHALSCRQRLARGGAGRDRLSGRSGRDRLDGGTGSDQLLAGGGRAGTRGLRLFDRAVKVERVR